ncbi:MAG: hypothetical protein Q9166_001455 [cf. Caloplaca sp. 2 TL-2023]
MAGEAPDPKTFGSWEDAFQYPIATVRGMERQLRNDISSNREKLSTSYRDLLGTAETIVEMDSQVQKVDSYLGSMGTRCNSRLLEKKVTNLKAWDNVRKATDRERYAFASQLAVLRGCPEVISRLLKTRGSVLVAAKVLVISRLLHKKLSQRQDPPPYLELLRNRLATLRRKLLARIDRRFQALESSESILVEAMCAFSLATSSSSTDVLRHFHHVRQTANSELGQREGDDKGICKSLRLIVKTLKDCQIIFPAQLARALEGLKTTALLQSPELQSLTELSLDIHQRWLEDDINSFIPYVRHDDLQKTEATKLLEQWAKNAFSSFLRDLRKMIGYLTSPSDIVQLRQEIIELWLSNKRHSTGVGTSDVFEGTRNSFNSRLQILIHQETASLSNVSSTIDTLLRDWKSGVSDRCPPIWDDAITTMSTAAGGLALKDALSIRAYGQTEPANAVTAAYTTWLNFIIHLERVITNLQDKKWTDDLDYMNDDDDMLEDIQDLLSENDPHLLHKTLKDDLEQSFQHLHDSILSYAKDLQSDMEDGSIAAHKSIFLLRIWRDISNHLPSIYRDLELETSFTPILRFRVSKTVLHKPISHCEIRITRSVRQKHLPARILWEGSPQLPVLPSPWAFRLLHETVRSMTGYGVDVWTHQATDILKRQMRDAIALVIGKLPEEKSEVNGQTTNGNSVHEGENSSDFKENGEAIRDYDDKEQRGILENEVTEELESTQKANGDVSNEPPGPSREVVRDMKIQRLFDTLYLNHATTIKGPDFDNSHDRFHAEQNTIKDDLDLPDQWLNHMEKDAEGYWRRTQLLFALLA